MNHLKQNKLKKWALRTLASLVVSVICISAISIYVTTEVFLPKYAQLADSVSIHESAILKDLKLLDSNPIFEESKNTNNAQDFLTQHISWIGETFKPLESSTHQILNKYKGQLTQLYTEENVNKILNNRELMNLNLSWLVQTLRYDHWDFTTHPEIRKRILTASNSKSLVQISIMAALPMPDITELRNFTLIYVLQEFKKGQIEQGLKVLRHIAKLIHTSNNLVSKMSTVALLKTELSLKKSLHFAEETFADEERLAAYKRLSWAWVQIAQLPWLNKSLDAFEPFLKPETAVCSAVGEISGPNNMKDFFEPHFIFENDMRSNFENQRKFQKKLYTICEAHYFEGFDQVPEEEFSKSLFVRLPASLYNMADGHQESKVQFNWARLPFIRRAFGGLLLSVGNPNWLRQYDHLAEAK